MLICAQVPLQTGACNRLYVSSCASGCTQLTVVVDSYREHAMPDTLAFFSHVLGLHVLQASSQAQLGSKMASMAYCLKANPDLAVSGSRDEQRQAYLAKYLAMQMNAKQKAARKKQINQHQVKQRKQKQAPHMDVPGNHVQEAG